MLTGEELSMRDTGANDPEVMSL